MKFHYRPSPVVRFRQKTQHIMFELTVGLLLTFLFGVAFYYVEYGVDYAIHAILLMVTAVSVAVVTEVLWALFLKKDIRKHLQGSFPWVTAIILALMVPINMTYFALAFGSFFAIFFAKLLFGGFGQNIFNPAAAGRAAILASFAGRVVADINTSATPISSIAQRGWIITDATAQAAFLDSFGGLTNLLIGWYPGALGETSALLILVIGIYLAWRRVIDWKVSVVYVGTVFVLGLVIALVQGVGLWYPLYHVFAGGVMFAAVFMLTDPVTNPTSTAGRIIFALGVGILTVLIRVQANLPGGVLYSILIMNIFTPTIERVTDGWQLDRLKKYITYTGAIAAVGIVLLAVVATQMEPVSGSDPIVDNGNGDQDNGTIPDATLGSSIGIFTDRTARPAGEVLEQYSEANIDVYLVSTAGYSVLEGGYDDAEPNLIEVGVDLAANEIVFVRIVEVNDTPGISDGLYAENFLSQFVGISLDNQDAAIDVVSNATVSSNSVARAVRATIDAIKGGQ